MPKKTIHIIWEGESIGVRTIYKGASGKVIYGLYRPGSPSSVFDHFEDKNQAYFIAKFIDDHGGSYESSMRKSARDAWDNLNEEDRRVECAGSDSQLAFL